MVKAFWRPPKSAVSLDVVATVYAFLVALFAKKVLHG